MQLLDIPNSGFRVERTSYSGHRLPHPRSPRCNVYYRNVVSSIVTTHRQATSRCHAVARIADTKCICIQIFTPDDIQQAIIMSLPDEAINAIVGLLLPFRAHALCFGSVRQV
jgi:hypothetical protein